MKFNFMNLPLSGLPYNNIQLCKQMMLRLYENIPFLPELKLIDSKDNIIYRTFANIPALTIKDGKLLLPESNDEQIEFASYLFQKILASDKLSDFEKFGFDAPYMEIYSAMLEKFEPEYTVIELIGPFSFANMVFNKSASSLLTNQVYINYICQAITVKAMWCVYKIKSISPKTKPIILFNENLLYKFGTLKRNNDSVTNEAAVSILQKVFSKVRKAGAIVGVQSFQKCNWKLVFDTNSVDLISFDAYNNPNNLNILADSVNRFLARGGSINWGIVPVTNENVIRSLNIDNLYMKLENTMEDLISSGVSSDLLFNNLTVSVQGNLTNYPILFAEKALIIANQLGKKVADNLK